MRAHGVSAPFEGFPEEKHMINVITTSHPTVRGIKAKSEARRNRAESRARHAQRLTTARLLAPMTDTERSWFGVSVARSVAETLAEYAFEDPTPTNIDRAPIVRKVAIAEYNTLADRGLLIDVGGSLVWDSRTENWITVQIAGVQ